MFITYNAFIKKKYQERCRNPKLQDIYAKSGGFKAFKRNYIFSIGFSEYLKFISDSKLTAIQTYHLAKIYIVYGKRSTATLPCVLASIIRQYNLDFPAVAGILTKEYWSERFTKAILA